jgi:hypothetical protein
LDAIYWSKSWISEDNLKKKRIILYNDDTTEAIHRKWIDEGKKFIVAGCWKKNIMRMERETYEKLSYYSKKEYK